MSEPSFSETDATTGKRHNFWALATVYSLLGPIAAFAKMGTVPLLILSIFGQRSPKECLSNLKHLGKSPHAIIIAALMVWCFASLIWSETPHGLSLARLACVVALALLISPAVELLRESEKTRLKYILVATLILLLGVLLIEGFTDAILHRILRPGDAAPRDGEWVPYLEMVAARGTSILAPFSFVCVALLYQIYRKIWFCLIFICLCFLATWLLPMQASSLAIVCGGFAYVIVRWKPNITTTLFFTAMIILALSTPFLMTTVLTTGYLQDIGLEPNRAFSQRLVIWEYSSNLVLENPFFGYGFDSSRDLGGQGKIIEGTNWPALPLHPHNAFLQIWLELGVVGICIVCALLWQIRSILIRKYAANQDIAVLVATLVAVLILALISFGVWQYWWIAMWGLLLGASRLLSRSH